MGATSEQPLAASPPGADSEQVPLVLVSNRGPVTFDAAGEVQRGSGGVVTALTGLASHRRAVWIASAMSEYDAEVLRKQLRTRAAALGVQVPAPAFGYLADPHSLSAEERHELERPLFGEAVARFLSNGGGAS